MPENKGYYQKYEVKRVDGKPVGRTFTLEIDTDPFARPALRAYLEAVRTSGLYPDLVKDLSLLLASPPEPVAEFTVDSPVEGR